MKVHYTTPYLLNPEHKITIDLIGVGGTGSQMLTNLARLSHALSALDHPGFHVRCWDADIVSEANIGRQLFSPVDIGHHKSIVLVSRINGFFGYSWEARNEVFTNKNGLSNVTISCVDTAATRLELQKNLTENIKDNHPTSQAYYWLDLGNGKKTGQAVLGTINKIKQPKSDFTTTEELQTVVQKFPELKTIDEADQGPSCSLAEAINKQDLFINSTLAQLGANLLWKLFREGMIKHHGCYVNLDTMITNPIKIA